MSKATESLFAHIAARVHSRWCGWSMEGTLARFRVATDARIDGKRHWEIVGYVSIEYAELIVSMEQRKRTKRIDSLVMALKLKIKQLPTTKGE